jgi:hypothetical protein
VVEARDELHAQVLGVRVVGQYVLAAVGLLPDRLLPRRRRRARVTETADTLERTEVVVEGPVLLHEHDDVLDVLDGAGAACGGDRGGALDAAGQRGEARGRTG